MNRTLARKCRTLLLTVVAASVVAPVTAPSQTRPVAAARNSSQKWQPANYKGLIMGKSKISDLAQVMGNAPSSAPPQSDPDFGRDVQVFHYPGKGDLGGDIDVVVRNHDQVVEKVTEHLKRSMPRTPAVKRFGQDYYDVAYGFADCAAKNGIVPIYRDKDGSLDLIEYPQKGIALWPDQYGVDIAAIVYLDKAPGLATPPPCVKQKTRKK